MNEIPHLLELPDLPNAAGEIAGLRGRHGITSRTFLFGVFGHLRESKRLPAVLRAFHRARASADIALLVAGEFVSQDLERSVALLLSGDRILRVGHTSETDFWLHAAAVDACINLRYPAAGESSGIGIRLMGLGKPVLVTAGCETSRFPEDACLRVDPGPAEEDLLAEYMIWLANFPADARACGDRAAAHIREFHNPGRVADLYWTAIRACYH
jgi:glycosyltransferase involved in cell wall biosynthesis